MAKIIAIMNEKGGVGKTVTATSIAYLLSKKGFKTALIDFDGQANASIVLGVENPNKISVTISTLLNKIINEEPIPPLVEYVFRSPSGVDLIPANSELYVLERNLCNVDFRETKLKQYIDSIKGEYDYIIIDCMPQMGTPMINVMMCSDSIIIPTQSEILSAKGLSELIKHFQSIRKNSNHSLKIEGILITMDMERTIVSAGVKSVIDAAFGGNINIFKTCIPRSIKVAEACMYGQTICQYAPENPASTAYENLVKELLENEYSR